MTREEAIKHIRHLQREYVQDDKSVSACDLAIAALSGVLVGALVASFPVFSLVLVIAILWVT